MHCMQEALTKITAFCRDISKPKKGEIAVVKQVSRFSYQKFTLIALQVKSYKTYVKREIENQSRLRHPLIITIKEVSI